jgi:hypothetical protein
MNTEFITLENQIDLKVWLQSSINECDAHIGWREDFIRDKGKGKTDTDKFLIEKRLEELSNIKFRKRWLEVQLSKF